MAAEVNTVPDHVDLRVHDRVALDEIELYAEVFAAAGALEKLEAFAAVHGAAFYGLPRNGGTITLVPEPWEVPASYPFGTEELVPLRAGERIAWRLAP